MLNSKLNTLVLLGSERQRPLKAIDCLIDTHCSRFIA